MRNWSMVRTGSTSSQKSLFFNMRRVQARLEREAMANEGDTRQASAAPDDRDRGGRAAA
jgi:DNA-directed RNA polymerase sigma subunit (sigma70/sigma32)